MSAPRYPDSADAQARLEAWHRAKDAESEPLRAQAAAQDARRGPQEARDGAAEAVRVFGPQERTEGRRGPW